jgi:hypothetical protein
MAVSMPVTGNLQFVHHQSIDVKITGAAVAFNAAANDELIVGQRS